MREPPKIAEEDLRACVQDQYELVLVTLAFLSLGHDYDAGVYRAVNERGTAYLLKVTSRPLYEPRCQVPPLSARSGDHLRRGSPSYQEWGVVDNACGMDRDRLPLDLWG
jgi:hypothetical protein